MAKLTTSDLSSLANETSAIATINANSAAIEAALENTLSRDGTTPNEMESTLDMNSNRIINLPYPGSATEPLRLTDLPLVVLSDGEIPHFASKGAAEVTSVGSDVPFFKIEGYFTPGDGGGGVYAQVQSEPAHEGKIETADGIWWELTEPVVTTAMFGATSAIDCSDAIEACVEYVKEKGARHMIISPFVHTFGTPLVFDLPEKSVLTFQGALLSTCTGGTHVTIGDTADNTWNLTVNQINVRRASLDGTATGVKLVNLVSCLISFNWVSGFGTGVSCSGTGKGFVYNQLFMGFHHDSTINLLLTASGGIGGYCNENVFYGGSFNHSTSWPAATSSVNIEVVHYASNVLNNNRFFCPSFEDNQDPTYARAANIEGHNNIIYWPRMENPGGQTTYLIRFGANSLDCHVLNGFTLVDSNISDGGTNNTIETRESLWLKKAAGASGTVHTAQSISSNSAKLYRGLDTSANEVFSVTGAGILNVTGAYAVDGTQVVGNRGAAVANATDATSVIDRLNDLLSRLRTHGLIAA